MLQHLPSIPVIVAVLAAALASFSRVFQASRPAWGSLPAWVQTLAPTLLAACGAVVSGLAGVTTPTDLMVVLVAGFMVLLPGLPSNRSAAPLQVGQPATSTPSAGDVAVASAISAGTIKPAAPKAPSVPPGVGLMLCLFALCLAGCPAFSKVNWPSVVSNCVPSKDTLIVEVTNILLNDSAADYPGALEKLAETEGGDAVACAVNQVVNQLGAATASLTAATTSAIARGKAFLAAHRVKVEPAQ